MDERIRGYVDEVVGHLTVDEPMRRRIAGDLLADLQAAADRDGVSAALRHMGTPRDMALSLNAGFDDAGDRALPVADGHYEYRSRTTLFGLPLVHVILSNGRRSRGIGVAKGIIAIGDVALGVVAIGGVSLGIISMGGVAAGLLAFGGVGLGLLLAIGGLAIGGLAIGGCAIGIFAMGAAAVGQQVATGAYAQAKIAITLEESGRYLLRMNGEAIPGATAEQIRSAIMALEPHLPSFLLRLLTMGAK